MTLSRSPLGRTSFLWAAGFVVLAILGWVVGRLAVSRLSETRGDTYYVVAHLHYVLSLAAAFLVFAGVYFALERLRRGRHRQLLGGLHFGGTLAGGLALFAPALLLGSVQHPQGPADPAASFRLWNEISAAGYGLSLVSQLFFVAVLVDALRRAPQMG
jgi:cytochrome c oxidase subunit 1